MPKFLSRPLVIDAEQFTDIDNPPRGVGFYSGRTGCEFGVVTIQGVMVRVHLGEWIVREAEGDETHFYPISEGKFPGLYMPLATEGVVAELGLPLLSAVSPALNVMRKIEQKIASLEKDIENEHNKELKIVYSDRLSLLQDVLKDSR